MFGGGDAPAAPNGGDDDMFGGGDDIMGGGDLMVDRCGV